MESSRGVVDGAFRVLRALPGAGTTRQVARLSRLTGLPRPTVYRLLDQLREAGTVEHRDGRWMLAPGLLGLARQVEPFPGLRETAMKVIRPLREATGGAVSLVVADGEAFVALEMVPGRELVTAMDARSGAEMPAWTAAGQLLGSGRPRIPRPGSGVAVDHGPALAGLTCYAVPVELPQGRRAALQIATVDRPAAIFAAPTHRAAAALEKQLRLSGQRTDDGTQGGDPATIRP
jgi:IclR family transcriptional regulator, acetate operon repressor